MIMIISLAPSTVLNDNDNNNIYEVNDKWMN